MKKLIALISVAASALSPLAFGVTGPLVQGMYDGEIASHYIPFVSGAGANAVIATTQSVAAGYLPLTGGALTGPLTVGGNLTSQGINATVYSVTVPPVLTAFGTISTATSGGASILFTGTNYGGISLVDPTMATNAKTAQWINFTGSFQARFVSDDGSTAKTALAFTGSSAGVTSITSSSGNGAWSHTGAMNVSGQLSANPVQGAGYNWLNIAGAASGISPSITTGGGNSNVSLNINTQGAGGVAINANTNVTGSLTATGNISATGTGTMPVYGNTGTAFPAQHMTVGYQALTAGTATVTFSGAGAFTSVTSYVCTATDSSGSAAVMARAVSGTSLTLSGTGTDTIAYQCVGN